MSSQVWWFVARSSGIVAWALLSASVVWGLLLSTKVSTTRIAARRLRPAWLLDLHRHLGGLAVIFTAIHLIGIVADSYVTFGWADVLVPMASEWKPGAIAFGVVAMYLLIAVEATSLAIRHLPRSVWRWIHRSSFVLYATATWHGIAAGTDAENQWFRAAAWLSVGLVLALTLRLLVILRRSAAAVVADEPAAAAALAAPEIPSPTPVPASALASTPAPARSPTPAPARPPTPSAQRSTRHVPAPTPAPPPADPTANQTPRTMVPPPSPVPVTPTPRTLVPPPPPPPVPVAPAPLASPAPARPVPPPPAPAGGHSRAPLKADIAPLPGSVSEMTTPPASVPSMPTSTPEPNRPVAPGPLAAPAGPSEQEDRELPTPELVSAATGGGDLAPPTAGS